MTYVINTRPSQLFAARQSFGFRSAQMGMPWPAWLAVLLLSAAGVATITLMVVPVRTHETVSNAVLAAVEPHPFPMVIPRSRISSLHMQDGAAVFCDRDMKECISHHISGWISDIRTKCSPYGFCTATVKHYFLQNDIILWVICVCLSPMILVFVCLFIGGRPACLIKAAYMTFMETIDRNDANMYESRFNQCILACHRAILFEKATGDGYAWKHKRDMYMDTATLMTFTPEEGFRLRLLCDGAPVFPAWRFRRAEKADAGTPVPATWVDAMARRNEANIRMDVGQGIGIEWRADGMRVWINDRAYDSYPAEPAPDVATTPAAPATA